MNSTQNKNKFLLDDFHPADYSAWLEEALRSLKGKPIEKLNFRSLENIIIKPIYFPDDSYFASDKAELYPAVFPYKRGTDIPSNDGFKWDICQFISADDPVSYNTALLNELNNGGNAIHLNLEHFDLKSKSDFEHLFANVDALRYPFYIDADICSIAKLEYLLEYFCDAYHKQTKDIRIFVIFDPIAQLTDRGSLLNHPKDLYLDYTNLIAKHKHNFPQSKFLGIDASVYSKKGANSVQQASLTLAAGLYYLEVLNKNIDNAEDFITDFHFRFSVESNFFMEVSKVRAFRQLWAKLIQEAGVSDDTLCKTRIWMTTNQTNKSVLDKYNNILRSTSEAVSAVIAGADAITVHPFDTLNNDNTMAHRLARNTQLVLLNECMLNEVIDPAGGSWFIESLTHQFSGSALQQLIEIDERGGILNSLTSGNVKSIIEETIASRTHSIRHRRESIIGVNKHPNSKDKLDSISVLLNPTLPNNHDAQIKIQYIPDYSPSIDFIRLRNKAIKFRSTFGQDPALFVASYGTVKQYKPRMDFVTEFLACGGISVNFVQAYASVSDMANDFLASGKQACVVCSSDDLYTEIIPEFANAVKKASPDKIIILAGYPADMIESYTNSGVDLFIHINADIVDVLNGIYTKLGIEEK